MLDLTVKLFQFKLLLSIEDCELWWFDIFASFSLVQSIRLFEPLWNVSKQKLITKIYYEFNCILS